MAAGEAQHRLQKRQGRKRQNQGDEITEI